MIQSVCVSAEQPEHCKRIDLPSGNVTHYSTLSDSSLVSPEDLFVSKIYQVKKAKSMTTLTFTLFHSCQAFYQSRGLLFPLRLVNQTTGRARSPNTKRQEIKDGGSKCLRG